MFEGAKRVDPGRSTVVLCPAKVNLHLAVLGRRPDGYHEIVSLMVPIDTLDELEISIKKGRGLELFCDDPSLPSGPGNLVYRAAELFANRTGLEGKVSIRLSKRIPLGAGLGGGSSDAAGTLLALNLLAPRKAPPEVLFEWAEELGADVPFFLMRRPCIARGKGELLEPVSVKVPVHLVLWYPGWQVSTKWVYESLRLGLTMKGKQITIPRLIEHLEGILGLLHNDLEIVTASEHPWVPRAKERLLEAGAKGVLMSGSGPTVFGIFATEEEAREAVCKIQVAPGQMLWYARGGLWPESICQSP